MSFLWKIFAYILHFTYINKESPVIVSKNDVYLIVIYHYISIEGDVIHHYSCITFLLYLLFK